MLRMISLQLDSTLSPNLLFKIFKLQWFLNKRQLILMAQIKVNSRLTLSDQLT